MIPLPQDKKIIVFDGVCNLCNHWVQFVIARDIKDQFRFVALQSDLGKQIIDHLKVNKSLDSIILYEPGVAYFYKSEAVLEICNTLGGWLVLVNVFNVIPQSLQDKLYDYVANNRYRWYGKNEQCMVPTPKIKSKFL